MISLACSNCFICQPVLLPALGKVAVGHQRRCSILFCLPASPLPHFPCSSCCRVPEELKRQSLADGNGGQYSTNLDRNRYGDDNQYLATVIRYNLEYLGLCPCLISVEILDAKTGGTTKQVSASSISCTCVKHDRVRAHSSRQSTHVQL